MYNYLINIHKILSWRNKIKTIDLLNPIEKINMYIIMEKAIIINNSKLICIWIQQIKNKDLYQQSKSGKKIKFQ